MIAGASDSGTPLWLVAFASVGPVLTFILGLFLEPWVARRWRAKEEEAGRRAEYQQLAVELRAYLWNHFSRNRKPADHGAGYVRWEGGLQERLVRVVEFAPDLAQRKAFDTVWREFEKLLRRVYTLDKVPPESTRRVEEATERYEQAYGETNYAIDLLVEALGGEKTTPRDSYVLALRDEGDHGMADLE
jgi:hypothetical protein